MKAWRLFVLLYMFSLPGLLLNGLGVFTMQLVNHYGISMNAVSWLEGFKDVSIWLAAFLLASYIPKMGYKKSIIIGTILGIVACFLMAQYPSFLSARLYFILVGVGFALIKVSIYSAVGLIAKNDTEHASFISLLEGFFMFSILSGFWLFAFSMRMGNWLYAFWVQISLSVIGLGLMCSTFIDESKVHIEERGHFSLSGYLDMILLLTRHVVWMFVILIFCYLFIEQGFINWLPTFNNKQLHIASAASVELASLLSAAIALGRLVFGVVMRYIHWSKVLIFCIVVSLITLFLSIYCISNMSVPEQEIQSWFDFPFVAYLLPLLGFLIGPIYPMISSSILSKQPINKQSVMTVWIVVFAALGATIGSRTVGLLFDHFGGLMAIGILAIPLLMLLTLFIPYYLQLSKIEVEND